MQNFTFEKLGLDKLSVVTPFFLEDNRGYFLKSYEREIFEEHGIYTDVFEDFESFSRKGVIRGLHFQTHEPQSKLVRAITGAIFDVAVDIRENSPTRGQWRGVFLTEENRKALFIPKGFAHGFMVVSEQALVSYKCGGKYLKECDTGIVWNDDKLKIDWPLNIVNKVIVSEKDSCLPLVTTLFPDWDKK